MSSSETATLSFQPTQPGFQTEVYLDIQAQPGAAVSATLSGPGIVGLIVQSAIVGSIGQVRLTWTIIVFGDYSVSGTAEGSSFSDSITVE